MKILKIIMASITLVAVLWVGNVNATNSVTLLGYIDPDPMAIDCDSGCLGFTTDSTPAVLSLTEASMYTLADSGEATELAFLNNVLLGTPGELTEVLKHDFDSETAVNPFTVSGSYFSIKQKSAGWWYFKNTSGGILEVTLPDNFNLVDDWSHYTEYSENPFDPSEVPIPAAAWLFGTAVLGLVGFQRRQTKVKA